MEEKLDFVTRQKVLNQVLKFEEFKAGRQDVADFWITFKGKFVHIRYFAVRDEQKNYRGVIEMSPRCYRYKSIARRKKTFTLGVVEIKSTTLLFDEVLTLS